MFAYELNRALADLNAAHLLPKQLTTQSTTIT